MWIETPESSNIKAFRHEGITLYVKFKGGTYAYAGVPEAVFEKMKAAESKGKFLNKEVKGKYPYTKL